MNLPLVAADVRRLQLLSPRQIRASLPRLLQFRGALRKLWLEEFSPPLRMEEGRGEEVPALRTDNPPRIQSETANPEAPLSASAGVMQLKQEATEGTEKGSGKSLGHPAKSRRHQTVFAS